MEQFSQDIPTPFGRPARCRGTGPAPLRRFSKTNQRHAGRAERKRNLPASVAARELLVKSGLEAVDGLAKEAGNDPALLWDLAGAYEGIASLQGSPDPSEPSLGDWD